MARKKKTDETVSYQINVDKFSLTQDKYIAELQQFLEEHLPESQANKSGGTIKIVAPKNVTKRMLRLRVKKFLYISGLNNDYRLIHSIGSELPGYEIVQR